MPFSGFSKLSLALTGLVVGGTLYLWFGGQELFTEKREKAEAAPRTTRRPLATLDASTFSDTWVTTEGSES